MKLITTLRAAIRRRKIKRLTAGLDPKGIAAQIHDRRLTYLSPQKLGMLVTSLEEVNRNGIEGRLVEAGCALGGSLTLLAAYAPDREISVYDTFEMIPPPGPEDPPDVHARYEVIAKGESKGIGGDVYYGYRGDLRDFVRQQVSEIVGTQAVDRIDLHKGLLQDTLALDEPVAFAHIDVDWYDPVKACLERLWPLMPSGGILILDDYFDWGGCRKAADGFFDTRDDMIFDDSAGNMKVTKV